MATHPVPRSLYPPISLQSATLIDLTISYLKQLHVCGEMKVHLWVGDMVGWGGWGGWRYGGMWWVGDMVGWGWVGVGWVGMWWEGDMVGDKIDQVWCVCVCVAVYSVQGFVMPSIRKQPTIDQSER